MIRDTEGLRAGDRLGRLVRLAPLVLGHRRELSERALESFGPDPAARGEMVESASHLLGEILGGREAPSGLADFLRAEREKSEWWARERR
jgi:hypothetical protein